MTQRFRKSAGHKPVIKHAMSSVLNRSTQSSGLSLNSKKSFKTETLNEVIRYLKHN